MAAIIGTAEVRILTQVAERPEIEIVRLLVPVTVRAPKGTNRVQVIVDTALLRKDMKRALRAAARAL